MCASYGLQIDAEDALEAFDTLDERESTAALEAWLAEQGERVVKPTGTHALNLNPIVRERARGDERPRTIDLAWWKLWVGGQPAKFPAINARVEKLLTSGAWKSPTLSRRALVPVTEYFEKGRAFRLAADDAASPGPRPLFALAGIWNVTKTTAVTGSEDWIVSYAIVTREAAPEVRGIHDRMPLIVIPELYDRWLDPELPADEALLDEVRAASDGPSARLEVF